MGWCGAVVWWFLLGLHFIFLLVVVHVSNPKHASSTGVHQAFGFNSKECHELSWDLQGWNRSKYLCTGATIGDPYRTTLHQLKGCDGVLPNPEDASAGRVWYTVCGKEGDVDWVWSVSFLLFVSAALHVVIVVGGSGGGSGRGGRTSKSKEK